MAATAVFKSIDDTVHSTAEAAERHDEVLTAWRSFESAARELQHTMLRATTTAEGEPFRFESRFYWYVSDGLYGVPSVYKLYFYPWDAEVQLVGGEHVTLRHFCGDNNEFALYRISDLYLTEEAATAACVVAAEKWIAEKQRMIDQLKARK